MNLRRPKSTVTDYRPPGAGARSPLERDSQPRPRAAASPETCWDAKGRRDAAEAAQHDKWVATLSPATLQAVAKDLANRCPHDRRDPEQRWLMGRKAAVLRRLVSERQTFSP